MSIAGAVCGALVDGGIGNDSVSLSFSSPTGPLQQYVMMHYVCVPNL